MTQRSRNSPKRSLPLARVYRLLEPEAVVKCGNVSGRRKDKFAAFGLTALQAAEVDTRLVTKYNFFVLEVCKAWIDPAVQAPRTIHHRGRGEFMVAGRTIRLRSRMM